VAKVQVAPYRCTDCGWTTAKWVGRCGECQAWGTVEEVGAVRARTTSVVASRTPAVPIGSVDIAAAHAIPTGTPELDRVLGGGFVPGAVLLLAGEPGVGKSTLLLDTAATWARSGRRALYVTGEESAAQVRLRAERIEAIADELYLCAETDLGSVLGQVDATAPSLLILDSVQTISSAEVDGAAGGVTQVKEVAASLIALAKSRDITVVLVGHVTKDGSVAGPRALEHLVDVVLHFEGDRQGPLRLVRAVKNRFGPADEIGCFELVDDGIIGLADPSGLFLGDRRNPAPGTCVTVTIEGRRPLVAEVQALIAPTSAPQPRRVTSGLDSSRIAMMLGVLERRAGSSWPPPTASSPPSERPPRGARDRHGRGPGDRQQRRRPRAAGRTGRLRRDRARGRRAPHRLARAPAGRGAPAGLHRGDHPRAGPACPWAGGRSAGRDAHSRGGLHPRGHRHRAAAVAH
jgi:DNA repair protein RadA/Sms